MKGTSFKRIAKITAVTVVSVWALTATLFTLLLIEVTNVLTTQNEYLRWLIDQSYNTAPPPVIQYVPMTPYEEPSQTPHYFMIRSSDGSTAIIEQLHLGVADTTNMVSLKI